MAKNGGTLNIREARTKPTSPDRSLLLIHNSYNQTKKATNTSTHANMYMVANQREERKALNMISTLGGKNDLLHQANHTNPANISSLSQNQRITATVELSKQGGSSITNMTTGSNAGNGANSKRKNFKNMFYSPKNNRDAFTEPHSKLAS